MFSVPHAPDRRDQAQGCGRARRGLCEEPARDQCAHVRTARPLLRFPALRRAERRSFLARCETGRHVSPCVFAARSPSEGRSLERSTDGDEVPWPETTKIIRVEMDAFRPCLGREPASFRRGCYSSKQWPNSATSPCPCRWTWRSPTAFLPMPLPSSADASSSHSASSARSEEHT